MSGDLREGKKKMKDQNFQLSHFRRVSYVHFPSFRGLAVKCISKTIPIKSEYCHRNGRKEGTANTFSSMQVDDLRVAFGFLQIKYLLSFITMFQLFLDQK